MTRVERDRHEDGVIPSPGQFDRKLYGTILGSNIQVVPSQFSGNSVDCHDWYGTPYKDSELDLKRVEIDAPTFHTNNIWRRGLSGTGSLDYIRIHSNEPCPCNYGFRNPAGVFAESPSIDWEDLMSKALANANPNRAVIQYPLALYELKDLPQLVRSAVVAWKSSGSYAYFREALKALSPKSSAGMHLSYKFGLAPIVNDILDLFSFADSVSQRLEYLDDLVKGTKLHRNLQSLSFDGNYAYNGDPYENPLLDCAGNHMVRTKVRPATYSGQREVWFTMKAKALSGIPSNLYERQRLAKKIVSGLYLDETFAWNALPWSWLIDWFSNFGELVSATRGTVRCTYRDLNIMVLDTQKVHIEWSKATGVIGPSSSEFIFTRKRRKVWAEPYLWPTLYLPILSDSQIAILGSLALIRPRYIT